MKEMQQIDKYVGNVHKKFMNKKTTTEDHFTRDIWFSMNLLQMALMNLKRVSSISLKPKQTYNSLLKECIEKNKTYNC